MIGTAGSDAKAELAYAHGCNHTIVYTRESFAERARKVTGGKGVSAVYDGIGKDTLTGLLDCPTPRGMMVTYDNTSGPVPPADLSVLSAKDLLKVTRPTPVTYTTRRELLEPMAAELLDVVNSGKVKIEIR